MAFRTDIQALRGLAVMQVVMFHAFPGFIEAGYLGVDIFFVVSGFLITGMIKSRIEQGTFSYSEFYFRRAKRLLSRLKNSTICCGLRHLFWCRVVTGFRAGCCSCLPVSHYISD